MSYQKSQWTPLERAWQKKKRIRSAPLIKTSEGHGTTYIERGCLPTYSYEKIKHIDFTAINLFTRYQGLTT